jgi:hypothetical protein
VSSVPVPAYEENVCPTIKDVDLELYERLNMNLSMQCETESYFPI